MKYGKMVLGLMVIPFVACEESSSNDDLTILSRSELVCDPIDSDRCCMGTLENCMNDSLGKLYTYREPVADYLDRTAKSNGACTGNVSGAYQCAQFAKDFFSNALNHSGPDREFTQKWSVYVDAKKDYESVALTVEKSYLPKGDPLFVYKSTNIGWDSLVEAPRETDVLVFENGGAGHFVIAKQPTLQSNGDVWIPIIEENVAKLASYGPSGSDASCHHRVLIGEKNDAGKWIVDSGINYQYTGFIRHNLAGIYPDTGWHKDGMSQLFRDAYLKIANGDSGKSLGWAFSDNGGSPFVHRVRNLELQNFKNTNPDNRFGTDGETALVVSPAIGASGPKSVHLLKEGFWGAYKCIPGSDGKPMGGAEYLGAPLSDEVQRGKIDGNCQTLPDSDSSPEVTYQLFDGGCMWWKNEVDAKVHVHLYSGALIDAEKASACGVNVENNPPSADCKDDCVPGTQQCFGSSQIKICGHPGPDSCYHWLTLNCGTGTSCVNNACVASSGSPVTISTIGTGGTSSTGGAPAVGGSSPTGTQNCTWHSRRCTSNPNTYQICIKDEYSGSTDWMSFDCASGMSCTDNTGVCSTVISSGTGGMSAVGGSSSVSTVSIATVSTGGVSATGGSSTLNPSGGSSVGGSSSLGGAVMIATGGVSMSSESTGGIASVISSGGSSVVMGGSVGTSGSSSSTSTSINDGLIFHYEGPVTGAHELSAYWQNPDGTTRAWGPVEECADTDFSDRVFKCALPIKSGATGFVFQVKLPDARYWGDISCDPTGGCGSTIGTVTITKGNVTLNYVMTPNPYSEPYYNGLLSNI